MTTTRIRSGLSSQRIIEALQKVSPETEDEAFAAFTAIRFAENGGEAFCPFCGCTDPYVITTRRKWKCRSCFKQFSATSGTIFASRKMTFVDLLAAIRILANSTSALQAAKDMGCQYRTAYALSGKIREWLRETAELT